MIDVNLTGAVAANISLLQPTKTDYLPLWTQVITTVLTAGVTLGGVYLNQYLNNKAAENKRVEEEKETRAESQKNACQTFLDVFSKPIPFYYYKWDDNPAIMSEIMGKIDDLSSTQLKAALDVIGFWDVVLPTPVEYRFLHRTIKSLNDIVETLLELRFSEKFGNSQKIEGLSALREIVSGEFSPIILKSLMTNN